MVNNTETNSIKLKINQKQSTKITNLVAYMVTSIFINLLLLCGPLFLKFSPYIHITKNKIILPYLPIYQIWHNSCTKVHTDYFVKSSNSIVTSLVAKRISTCPFGRQVSSPTEQTVDNTCYCGIFG